MLIKITFQNCIPKLFFFVFSSEIINEFEKMKFRLFALDKSDGNTFDLW